MSGHGIFIIGGNEEITSKLAARLHPHDLGEISVIEGAEEAFKRLENSVPKAVVCDIKPAPGNDIDGFQFSRLMKSPEHPEYATIPIFLYSTGRMDIQFEQLAKDVGTIRFTHLPEQLDYLVEMIANQLGGEPAEQAESSGRILVVEDDEDTLVGIRTALLSENYEVVEARDGDEAIKMVEIADPRVVLLDYRIPKKDGMTVLHWIKANKPATAAVIMTAYGSEVLAVDIMKAGADDYVRKPFEIDEILKVTARAMRKYGVRLVDIQFHETLSELEKLRSQVKERYGLENIIGNSKAMQEVFELVRKVAPTESNILVTGESGTGKELVAKAIHANSSRVNGAFVPVDCASLSETLLESELFGHEKGSFTGADHTRTGLLEYASGGTFFMDEVGKMPLATQAKFLRVLQEKSVRRLGGNEQTPVDIRVVAATNLEIEQAVKEHEFREDLYYRLNVVQIRIPPLRKRREDIPLLVHHFLNEFSKTSPRPIKGISPEAMTMLETYAWPGNVRELENTIERAVSLTDTAVIDKESLPVHIRDSGFAHFPTPDTAKSFKQAKEQWLEAFEQRYVKELLASHNNNVSAAAREAGIDRKTIHRLISKYNIKR